MTSKDLIGRFGPDYVLPIERGKVREFARAAYAAMPEHLDDEHAIMPATFLMTAGVSWGYTLERPRGTLFEDIDIDLSVPLHAEESYEFNGVPPRAGDQLIARSCLESITTKNGARGGELTFLVMLTEFRDQSNKNVAKARSTTVTTSSSPSDDGWASDVPSYKPNYENYESFDPFSHIQRETCDQLTVGFGPGPISTGALTLFEMVRFQAAGGEMNPLHYDAAHASAEGFPGMFGLGMQQASALASYASRWLGPNNVRSFRARFPNVFWIGDHLTYDGHITNLYETDSQSMADLLLECKRDSDQATVAKVWMTYVLHDGTETENC